MTAASWGPFIILIVLIPLLFVFFFFYIFSGSREDETERVNVQQRIERFEQEDQPSRSTGIMIRCLQCRSLNPESAKYCNECGAGLQ